MLHVVTGLLDDPRRALQPDHACYGVARTALEQQDEWAYGEHALFWRSALVAWPTAGRPIVDHLSAAAAQLRSYGLDLPEIADALGVAPGTIRLAPNQAHGERDRPNLVHGAELLGDKAGSSNRVGRTLERQAMPHCVALWCEDEPPLPRVFSIRTTRRSVRS